jgi:pimeloyl-ACP methyl ester carboxylesterase
LENVKLRTNSGLSYYIEGQGEPFVILGGGPGFSSRIYRHFLRPLTQKYQCLYWDYRGTGNSVSALSGSFQQDDQDFCEVLKDSGLESKSFTLFAHSYGSVLALHHAIQNTTAIQRLILCGSAVHLGAAAKDSILRKQHNLNPLNFKRYIELLSSAQSRTLTKEAELELFLIEGLNQLFRPEPWLLNEFAKNLEISFEILFNHSDWADLDFSTQIKKVTCPSVILTGAQDIIVPAIFSEPLSSSLPNVQTFPIQNCGHWPFIEKPKDFWQILI